MYPSAGELPLFIFLFSFFFSLTCFSIRISVSFFLFLFFTYWSMILKEFLSSFFLVNWGIKTEKLVFS